MKTMVKNIVAAVAMAAVASTGALAQTATQSAPLASKVMGKQLTLVDSLSMNYGKLYAVAALGIVKQIEAREDVVINKQVLYDAFTEVYNNPENNESRVQLETDIINQLERASFIARTNSPEAKANKAAEDEYIAKLKKDKKVKFTESGLAYKVDKKGSGEMFSGDKAIDVKYVGKHLDGTEFDKSEEAIPMQPGNMIEGFNEGLRLMSPGAKYTFYVPAALAYGLKGAGEGVIKRNEMLIFEVETIGESAEKSLPKPQRPERPERPGQPGQPGQPTPPPPADTQAK